MLATVLFTDVVGSTQKATELGDAAPGASSSSATTWPSVASCPLPWYEVKTIGDGFLATFDGPARAVIAPKASARR